VITHSEPARLADRPEDYARLDLDRRHIQQWEDGIRVDTGAPNLEWWYLDADLDDGAGLAILFCTKDGTRPNQPLAPQLEVDLTLPDGTRLVRSYYAKPEEFSASKDGCDVRIGPYRFTGDLHEYRITGGAEELWADIRLEGTTESWRPETGNLLFGRDDEHVFAWTPFVPFGKVTGTYKIGDEVHEATGRGYHDHNWTNTDLGHLIDHWWWARGEVGPYTFIAAHIVATEKYGYTPFHWYMLARDGKPIADDGSKMTFATHGAEIDEHTAKPVPDAISFDYQDDDARYELTLTRQKTLVDYTWIDFAKGWQKAMLKLIRYPGGYMRFAATTSLKVYRAGELVERYESTGAFEQIFYAREIHEESLERDAARR
jgi:hypothetical protein